MGWAIVRAGNRAKADGTPLVALEEYAKAIAATGPTLAKHSSCDSARQCLRQAHWARGQILAATEKHGDAAKEFSRALELSIGPDRIDPLSFLVLSRLHAGQTVDALQGADELAKMDSPSALYNAACVYSLASGKIADKKQEYADRAMALLQKSVQAGHRAVANIKQDTDLDPIRDRDDFKKLLSELEKATTPKKTVAPKPREVK